MTFWVYIVRCADDSYYTGHTDNIDARLHQHHTGEITSCYTFKRRLLQLMFSQEFPTREEALASEQQIKGWSRKKKDAMMQGNWAEVSRLAKSSANTVRSEPFALTQKRPVEETECNEVHASSVHPSTSSGRTDDEN